MPSPAVNQTAIPRGMTSMTLNPAEDGQKEEKGRQIDKQKEEVKQNEIRTALSF